MISLAESYRSSTATSELKTAMDEVSGEIPRLRIPKDHLPISVEDYKNTPLKKMAPAASFAGRWQRFQNILENPSPDDTPDYRLSALSWLAWHDLDYQHAPRPGRRPGSDPHTSVVREYVLGNSLQGSDHLLSIRDKLREAAHNALGTPDETHLSTLMKALEKVLGGANTQISISTRRIAD